MRLLLFLYIIILCRSIIIGDWLYKILVLVAGVVLILSICGIRKLKVMSVKEQIEKFEQNPDAEISPFVNVNRDDWFVFQELPHINRVQAKKIVWIRKHNGWYASLEDFFKKNEH